MFCSDIISTAKKLAVFWLSKDGYYTEILQQTKCFWNYLKHDITIKGICTLYCSRNSGDGSWVLAITSRFITNSLLFPSWLREQSRLCPWELQDLWQEILGLWATHSWEQCRAGTAWSRRQGTTCSVLPSCLWVHCALQQLEELIDHVSGAATEPSNCSDYSDQITTQFFLLCLWDAAAHLTFYSWQMVDLLSVWMGAAGLILFPPPHHS